MLDKSTILRLKKKKRKGSHLFDVGYWIHLTAIVSEIWLGSLPIVSEKLFFKFYSGTFHSSWKCIIKHCSNLFSQSWEVTMFLDFNSVFPVTDRKTQPIGRLLSYILQKVTEWERDTIHSILFCAATWNFKSLQINYCFFWSLETSTRVWSLQHSWLLWILFQPILNRLHTLCDRLKWNEMNNMDKMVAR